MFEGRCALATSEMMRLAKLVKEIVSVLDDGAPKALRLPGGEARGSGPEPDNTRANPAEPKWPPDDEWHFRNAQVCFAGCEFDLDSVPFQLLQALAEARRRYGYDDLFDQVREWRESRPEQSNVRAQLSSLRTRLRTALKLRAEFEPLPKTKGGWEMNSQIKTAAAYRALNQNSAE